MRSVFRRPEQLMSDLEVNTRGCANPETTRPVRADHQAWAGARPRDAGRGRLSGVRPPGRLRAFYERIHARREMQIAVVATARKLELRAGTHLVAATKAARPRTTSARPAAASSRSPNRPAGVRQLVADWQAKGPRPQSGRGRRQMPGGSRPACTFPNAGRPRAWEEQPATDQAAARSFAHPVAL